MTGVAFLSDEYATCVGLTVVLAHGRSHYFLSSINRRQLSARVLIRAVTSLVVMRAGTCCFTVIRSPPSRDLYETGVDVGLLRPPYFLICSICRDLRSFASASFSLTASIKLLTDFDAS